MKRKLLSLLLTVCIIFTEIVMMSSAFADIPAEVKDSYTYNTRDNSIILVKKRLEELGYFEKGTQYSNYVSEGLKETVLIFQKKNNVTMDGVIDRDFLELLFSDQAVDASGRSAAAKTVKTATPAPEPTPSPAPSRAPKAETAAADEIPVIKVSESYGSAADASASKKETGFGKTVLVVLGVLVFAGLVITGIIRGNRPQLYDIPSELSRTEQLSGQSFSYWCAELLANLGCSRVEAIETTGDSGIDIIFYTDGIKGIAQCKRYIKPVGTRSIREIIRARDYYRAKRMMIITNNCFTESAWSLAGESGVVLWDRKALKNKMKIANEAYAKGKNRGTRAKLRDPGMDQNEYHGLER